MLAYWQRLEQFAAWLALHATHVQRLDLSFMRMSVSGAEDASYAAYIADARAALVAALSACSGVCELRLFQHLRSSDSFDVGHWVLQLPQLQRLSVSCVVQGAGRLTVTGLVGLTQLQELVRAVGCVRLGMERRKWHDMYVFLSCTVSESLFHSGCLPSFICSTYGQAS